LVVIDVNANSIEQPAAAIIPILIGSIPGLATNKIPQKPTIAEPILIGVNFSERKNGAHIATQIGTENSKANSWAKGIKVNAKNHKFCPMKCPKFRTKCNFNFLKRSFFRFPVADPIMTTIITPITDL